MAANHHIDGRICPRLNSDLCTLKVIYISYRMMLCAKRWWNAGTENATIWWCQGYCYPLHSLYLQSLMYAPNNLLYFLISHLRSSNRSCSPVKQVGCPRRFLSIKEQTEPGYQQLIEQNSLLHAHASPKTAQIRYMRSHATSGSVVFSSNLATASRLQQECLSTPSVIFLCSPNAF